MYNNLEILDKEQRFEIIFNSCPFIKKIKSATKDETNEYNDYIYKMIAKEKNIVDSLENQMLDLMMV